MNLYIVRIGNSYVRGIRYRGKNGNTDFYARTGSGDDPVWIQGYKMSICLTADKDNALRLLGYIAGSISYHFSGEAVWIEEEMS